MNRSSLKRELRLIDLVMASLGGIIGSGWLFGALYSANVAGPAAILSWVLGGVAVILIGLIFAELTGMLPESGGVARYPHYSHGHLTSFIMGWAVWIGYAASPAIQAEAMVQYSAHYFPGLFNTHTNTIQPTGLLIAAVLMLAFFLINYLGVRSFARVNTPLTLIKFIMPTLTIVVFLMTGLHWHNVTAEHFAPYGSAGVLQAIATSGIIFSYLGFRQAVDLAGEAKNPHRDVPRAIMLSIGIGIVLYSLLQVVFIAAVPPSALSHGWAKLSMAAPFAQLAVGLNLGWLTSLLYADAIVSPTGTGNVYLASTTRVLYAMAQNGYLPKSLAKVDAKTGIPLASLVLALILGLLFLAPFPAWNQLVGVISSATVITYIMGPVSAAVFRRTAPGARRYYRVPALHVVAPIAFVIGSWIIYWTGWAVDWKLLVAMLVGVVLYALFAAMLPGQIERPSIKSVKSGIWLVVYLIGMLGMSYAGSHRFGSPYNRHKGLIHFPYDLIVSALMALVFYYWGVASGYPTAHLEEALNSNERETTEGQPDVLLP